MKGETISSTIATRKCKDGSIGEHVLSANPIFDCDNIIGIEGFIMDITDLKK